MLTCGLIGLPGSGKTTLFALLAGPHAASTVATDRGTGAARRVVAVPDPRLDLLARHYRPEKTIHAQLEVVDIPGLIPGERARATHFLEAVRGSDALIYVVRGFADPALDGPDGPAPLGELQSLEAELILADLAMVERRLEKLAAGGTVRRPDQPLHQLLTRLGESLGEGVPFRDVALSSEEAGLLTHTLFLSAKPAVWVLNVAEADLGHRAEQSGLAALARERGVPLVTISAQVEREIAELSPEDAALFLGDLGLDQAGVSRVIRGVYERLGLISFFTVGDDEVRAWTIRRGTRAREAAGKVHSDMERGFIRAEVIAYADYLVAAAAAAEAGGGRGNASLGDRAEVVAKEKGLTRLEGRDYTVEDGDIISIRFNV